MHTASSDNKQVSTFTSTLGALLLCNNGLRCSSHSVPFLFLIRVSTMQLPQWGLPCRAKYRLHILHICCHPAEHFDSE